MAADKNTDSGPGPRTSFAVALGTAAQLAADDLAAGGHHRIQDLRDRLHRRLDAGLPDRVLLNGPAEGRLPNTLNISIRGVAGHSLLAATPGIAASTGSACHSGSHTPSPVLTAMGLDADRSLCALRLSLGRWSSRDDIDHATDLITTSAAPHRHHRRTQRTGTTVAEAQPGRPPEPADYTGGHTASSRA
jgi:cysteine desulfurase